MVSCPWIFFLTALTRISTCETCSTCAIKWQCPLCNMRSFKTWLCLYIPLLLSPSPGSSSHGVFPTSLHLLCSAPVLQDLALRWGYRFIWCAGWEEHLFSLVMDSSTFLEGFCFFLSQVLTVPMLGNIPSLALVFHSSASGAYSDCRDIFTSWVSPDPVWGGSVLAKVHTPKHCAARTLDKALCTVSEQFCIEIKVPKNRYTELCRFFK